jgi:hypothetical protein
MNRPIAPKLALHPRWRWKSYFPPEEYDGIGGRRFLDGNGKILLLMSPIELGCDG